VNTPGGVELTRHAVEAMLARDVSPAEVDLVLREPEQTYEAPGRRGGPVRTTFQRRDLAVVLGEGVVVTVLYRQGERYAAGDRRPSGRRLSKNTRRRLAAELRRTA
jgi:hypothetical protein